MPNPILGFCNSVRNVLVSDHTLVQSRGRRWSVAVTPCSTTTKNIMIISLIFLLPAILQGQMQRIWSFSFPTLPNFYAQFLKQNLALQFQHSPRSCHPGTSTALTWVRLCSSVLLLLSHIWDQISVKMHSISLIHLGGYRTGLRHSGELKYWRNWKNWINLYLKHFFCTIRPLGNRTCISVENISNFHYQERMVWLWEHWGFLFVWGFF